MTSIEDLRDIVSLRDLEEQVGEEEQKDFHLHNRAEFILIGRDAGA